MIGNKGDIGRKECLVLIVNPHRNIGPPQKGLRQGRPVVQPDPGLDNRLARRKTDAHHAFHSQHGIVFAEPHGAAAIGVLLDRRMDRHISGRAVVLRPVELNAAGDPWSQQSHQRRLDHVLPVKEIVLVGLVETRVNSPANFGKDHQLDIFVLEEDRPVTGLSTFSRATRSVNGLGYTFPLLPW